MYIYGKTTKELIENGRKTGKGIVIDFQENPTYIKAINGLHCPHCGALNGGENKQIIRKYETPLNIKCMMEEVGYSWTEDCKCGVCNKLYSRGNGC
ncbi:hypothetical protein [Clostridium perfringens]|uniref:hypothetical protein n=1 Tax=Clostridium perfringens TaxID=1502 RepID=UPI0037480E89